MKALLEKVFAFVQRNNLLEDDFTVVVAVSGGADSVALLHILHALKNERLPGLRLHVAHLNHRLRKEESEEDAAFVKDLAEHLSLSFTVESIDVGALAKQQGQNLEETARLLRYDFLKRVAQEIGAERIATGHTMDDQAETLLMRLLRGSGPEGLSGIHPLVDGLIIRPLLCVKREQILDYCREAGLAFRIDSTNLSLDYTRNRIRQRLLPLLAEFNPQVVEALARTADLLREEDEFLRNMALQAIAEVCADVRRCRKSSKPCRLILPVDLFLSGHKSLRRRILREAIRLSYGHLERIEMIHLQAVEALLGQQKSGKRVVLPGGITVAREFDRLIFAPAASAAEPYLYELNEGESLQIQGLKLRLKRVRKCNYSAKAGGHLAALLDEKKVDLPLLVRPRRAGERYRPVGSRREKKIKDLMIDYKIPVSARSLWPVVVASGSDEIIWSPRLPASARFVAADQTKSCLLIEAEETLLGEAEFDDK